MDVFMGNVVINCQKFTSWMFKLLDGISKEKHWQGHTVFSKSGISNRCTDASVWVMLCLDWVLVYIQEYCVSTGCSSIYLYRISLFVRNNDSVSGWWTTVVYFKKTQLFDQVTLPDVHLLVNIPTCWFRHVWCVLCQLCPLRQVERRGGAAGRSLVYSLVYL